MPLNNAAAEISGPLIATALQALSEADKQDASKLWTEVLKQINTYLTTNATLSGNATGVTAGGAVSGPLAGGLL